MQWVKFSLLVYFGDLALFISKYILFDISNHMGPLVVLCDEFVSLSVS